MSKKKLFGIGLLICVVALPVFGCIFKWKSGLVSPYLLFLTLITIFWYSYETRGLKAQMVMQNELSMRPRLIFIETISKARLVKNIGNGAALDIHIQDYSHQIEGLFTIKYRFECQNILEPGADCELNIGTVEGDKIQNAGPLELAQLLLYTFEIKLNYKNVLGQEYSKDTSILGKEMLRWTSFPR
ncbi:MAG: hypothetical protein IMZ61_08405 [Planctomycetes bacterium]|nr:hypothetical protein [Planctomycetota bacterium]